MYNPEKCNPLSRRLLTVTLEKISSFFHFVLDFMREKVYTCSVIRKEEVSVRKVRLLPYKMIPNLLSRHEYFCCFSISFRG